MKEILLLSLFGISLVSGIFAPGFNGGGGGGGFGGRSSSSSSEEHGHGHGHGHGNGHGHGHGHGRPPRPRPPRPPPVSDPVCESGWMTFQRAAGTWCVKVFYSPGNKYSADALCSAQGAVLTGLQDANERLQIANAGRTLTNQYGGGFAEVWVGASRKANCNSRYACSPNDTFQWTDGQTTGTSGFYFPGQEPNFSYSAAWGSQDCLELHVSVADGVAARYGYSQGDLDDQHCQQTEVRLVACGKLAS